RNTGVRPGAQGSELTRSRSGRTITMASACRARVEGRQFPLANARFGCGPRRALRAGFCFRELFVEHPGIVAHRCTARRSEPGDHGQAEHHHFGAERDTYLVIEQRHGLRREWRMERTTTSTGNQYGNAYNHRDFRLRPWLLDTGRL